MPRNRSEAPVVPPAGASDEVLECFRLEAFGPLKAYLAFSTERNVSAEYYAIDFETRCRYRAALRKAAGLPERSNGVGCPG